MSYQDSCVEKHPDASLPLLSVVMPVYNGEKYLAEAIDSILAQTFNDFEIIMIDDGSTDGSLSILRQYEARDARIKLISRENRNLATTLNDSIDIARGVWIARMDQDDIAVPCRFEKQLQWLERTRADMCGSWVQRFGTRDKRLIRLCETDEAIKIRMLFANPFAHPTVMMRRELARKLRYDKTWEKAEDYDLWERAAEAGWIMSNVPEVLLLYRLHGTQISSDTPLQHQLCQKIRRRYWTSVFEAMQLDLSYIDEVLKIDEPVFSMPDMEVVDIVLRELLLRTHGEARDVMKAHALRLYSRVAPSCPDVVTRWKELNQKIGESPVILTLLRLYILHILKLHSENRMFVLLKKLYVSLRRTA